jgi:hypothetical protein
VGHVECHQGDTAGPAGLGKDEGHVQAGIRYGWPAGRQDGDRRSGHWINDMAILAPQQMIAAIEMNSAADVDEEIVRARKPIRRYGK